MSILIKEIANKSQWESFVTANENTFLQSWDWGEFNKNTGDPTKSGAGKIWRLGVFEDDNLMAVALVIRVNAKRGSFLFVPQGPVIENEKFENETCLPAGRNEKLWKDFFQHLKNLGRREGVDFVRISPLLENTVKNREIFKKAGFRDAPIHMMHPETTWLLNVTASEEELLRGMRKTHRNLIRRAQKEGVEIIQGCEEKYLKAFYDIHMETVGRHKFVPFPYDYMRGEVEAFLPDNQISIFSACYKKEIISSAIIVFYGNQAFYHHGASSSKYGRIPASYLNLWEAVKEAKKRGKEFFNFYGIVENKPKHPWSGLSNFKKGFGGFKKELLHCQDLPLGKKYIISYIVETARNIKRGY